VFPRQIYSTKDPITHDLTPLLNNPNYNTTAPAGGYLMSVIASAAQHYFTTHHYNLNQPNIATTHVEFPGHSIISPCKIHITDLNLSRQFLHRARPATPRNRDMSLKRSGHKET